MGRKVAIPWHASFSIAAGVLYFFCVLPRWYELMGDMSRGLGMAGRIASGALIGLAALPVVFNLLRVRKPELGTPQLALSIRVWSIVAHVLAGVLIIGTAISEVWLNLNLVGQWLFGIYGAAAAIGVLGFFAFYLSLVAELPAPPPKPIKAKKPKRRRLRRKKVGEADEADAEVTEDTEETEDADEDTEDTADADDVTDTAEEAEGAEPEAEQTETGAEGTEEPTGGLRNRRPTGKGTHRMRRRRTHGGVAVDE